MVAPVEGYTKNFKNVGEFYKLKQLVQTQPEAHWLKAVQKDKKAGIHIICNYASSGGSNREGYTKNLKNVGQFLQTTGSKTTRQWM